MGVFARARRKPAGDIEERAPLSKTQVFLILMVVGFFGYIISKEITLPKAVLFGGAAIGLVILLFAALRYPNAALYSMVAYIPFSKILAGDFGGAAAALNATNLLFIIIFLGYFSTAARTGKGFEPHTLHIPIMLYAIFAIASFVNAGIGIGPAFFNETISDMKRWMDPIVIYFLFFHVVRDKKTWKTIVVVIMIGVTVAALMASYEYLNAGTGSIESTRVSGIAGQPNILGAFFVYYMFLFLSFWLENIKKPGAWGYLIPLLICFRGIMVTFSRGAYLAFAQGLLGITFFKNKLLFGLACAAIAFAVLNPWMLPEGIRYRMESTFRPKTQLIDPYSTDMAPANLDTSSSHRLEIWAGGWEIIKAHPVLGVGLGQFGGYIIEYVPQLGKIDAHNAYIITAAELGIPALVSFLVIILMLFRLCSVVYRNHSDPFIRATALGFLGGLSGLLMANMFGSRLSSAEVAGYFWMLAALMARAHAWTIEILAEKRAVVAEERRARLEKAGIINPRRRASGSGERPQR